MASPAKKISDDDNNSLGKTETTSKAETTLSEAAPKKNELGPYQVKKALYDEAAQIKNHQDMIQKRLEKMVEHKTDVSETVFFKVKTDYETQLSEVSREFRNQCALIEEELESLYQAKIEQQNEFHKHEEILEEANFRHKLGEYSNNKFKEVETKENREINKYQDLLRTILSSIEQYEGILGHSYEPQAKQARLAPPPPPPPAAPKTEAKAKAENKPEVKEVKIAPAAPQTPITSYAADSYSRGESTHSSIAISLAGFEAKEAKQSGSASPSLEDDLDALLGGEDYFSGQEEELEIPEVSEPSASEPHASFQDLSHIPQVSRTEPDNSISNILRDIPMEEQMENIKPSQIETKVAPAQANASPAAGMPEASLLLLEGDLEEEEYILSENTSIGRSPSNDLVLKEAKISRQHATINYRNGQYVLVDLKSSNGVLVNNKKVEEVTLQDGDELKMGSFKFQFNLL